MKENIYEISFQLIREYYKRLSDHKVFLYHENFIFDNELLKAEIIEEAKSTESSVKYIAHYYKLKHEANFKRKTYAVSLKDNIYLGSLVLKYYKQEYQARFHNKKLYPSTFDDLVEDVFMHKRECGIAYVENKSFLEVDVKQFYPNLHIDIILAAIPNDKQGVLQELKGFYDKLYAQSESDFGLLQNTWHSWLLADIFLAQVDKEFLNEGMKFYRKGDKYYFTKKDYLSGVLNKVDVIFAKYKLNYNKEKLQIVKNKKSKRKCFTLLYKLIDSVFPVLQYKRYLMHNRFIICKIFNQAAERKINLQKLINSLFRETSWDDFELYHLLRMADFYNININKFLLQLSEKYPNASVFLKSQIRLQFFKHADKESVIDLVKSTEITETEIEDILKTLNYLNWKDEKMENLMSEIEV